MPVSLPDAICGPQVPGTVRPNNMSDLDNLNPCLATNCKVRARYIIFDWLS